MPMRNGENGVQYICQRCSQARELYRRIGNLARRSAKFSNK
jgi:hypothetical protein